MLGSPDINVNFMSRTLVEEDGAFEPYEDLIRQEQALEPTITVDDTLRVKVLDRCGMTCNFCHNEGTPVMSKVGFQALRVSIYSKSNRIPFNPADIISADVDSFQDSLVRLKEAGLANELHWTGGEPTLSKELPLLTSAAREAGYEVKMTSNGQSGVHRLGQLATAGLTGVNFSIFGTTPQELASTQGEAFSSNLRLAEQRLRMMDDAMNEALRVGMNVKANVVISGQQDIDRGLRLLAQAPADVKVRFQADTSARRESTAAIYSLMQQLEAHPVSRDQVAGCSIDNYDYELPDGRIVTFKQTRDSRLPSICDGCPIDAAGNCHEGYYGLRFYKDQANDYWVGACIQKMETAQTLDTFLSEKGLSASVKQYREDDYAALIQNKESKQ